MSRLKHPSLEKYKTRKERININTSVVLRGDVVRQIVIENEAEKTIEQRQVDLLGDLRKDSLHEDIAFSFTCLPNIREIVNALAPLYRPYQTCRWKRRKYTVPCRQAEAEARCPVNAIESVHKADADILLTAGLIQAGNSPRLSALARR